MLFKPDYYKQLQQILVALIISALMLSCTQESGGSDPVSSPTSSGGGGSSPGPLQVTVEQGSSQPDPTENFPIDYRANFSRDIEASSFSALDITQTGTATGVTFQLVRLSPRVYEIRALSATTDGTIVPTLNAGVLQDTSGNENDASTSFDNSVLYYEGFPVQLEQDGAQADPTETLPITFNISFDEVVDPSTFSVSDIEQTGSATGVTWNLTNSGDDQNFTLEATAVGTNGTVAPRVQGNSVENLSGLGNATSQSSDNSVLYLERFDVGVEQGSSQDDPTENLPVVFEVSFSSAIDPASFTSADIVQNGSATGVDWSITNVGDDQNFILQATNTTSEGTIVPSIAAGDVETNLGALNNASTSTDNSVLYAELFDVSVEQAGAQVDPTDSVPIVFDVSFDDVIDPSTFSVADIDQTGSAGGVTWNLINSGDDQNFTLQATAVASNGVVAPEVRVNTVENLLGVGNAPSNSVDNEVLYLANFDVEVEQGGSQNDPTQDLPVVFDVSFTSAINPASFTDADIVQNGSATGVSWSITNSGDDQNFTLEATSTTTTGTIIPSLDAGDVETDLGALNNASTSTDNSVLYTESFAVTIEQASGQMDPAGSLPVAFDVSFEKAIDPASFTVADITQNGDALGITWSITNSGDDQNFTLEATSVVTEGTLIPSIAADRVENSLTEVNLASTSTDNSVVYRTKIDVELVQSDLQTEDPTSLLPIQFEAQFSEEIDPATFTAADITQDGDATGVVWDITNFGDDQKFLVRATQVNGDEGEVRPRINVDRVSSAVDAAVMNRASTSGADNTVTYDTSYTVTLTVTGATEIVADGTSSTTLRANVKDVQGNNVESVTVRLDIPANGGSDNGDQTTNGAGNADFTLTSSTVADIYDYTATVTDNGSVSPSTQVEFTPGPPDTITLAVTGATEIVADGASTTTLEATVEDQFGNLIPDTSVDLVIPTDGGSVATNPADTNASGVASFTLTSSTLTGDYDYTAETGALSSNIETVTFVAGAVDTVTLTLTGAATLVANGTDTTTFNVVLEDAFGNVVPDESVTLNIPGNGGSAAQPMQTSDANGEVNYTLTASTVAGTYNYTATAATVNSNQESVTFDPGPVNSVTLSVTGATLIGADTIQSTTLEAVVEDVHGNLIPNESVSLNIPADGGTVGANPVDTNVNGEVGWTLTSSLVEDVYNYTATADSVVSNTSQVEFKAAEMSWNTNAYSYPTGNQTQGFTLENVGEAESGTVNVNLTINSGADVWNLTADNCSGTTLDKSETCTITVQKDNCGLGCAFGGGVGTATVSGEADPGGNDEITLDQQ